MNYWKMLTFSLGRDQGAETHVFIIRYGNLLYPGLKVEVLLALNTTQLSVSRKATGSVSDLAKFTQHCCYGRMEYYTVLLCLVIRDHEISPNDLFLNPLACLSHMMSFRNISVSAEKTYLALGLIRIVLFHY